MECRKERIFLTGFPLPLDLLGKNLATIKSDVGQRLCILDPNNRFWTNHRRSVEQFSREKELHLSHQRPRSPRPTRSWSRRQKEIGGALPMSVKERIRAGTMRLNLVAGIRPEVISYFPRYQEKHRSDPTSGFTLLKH